MKNVGIGKVDSFMVEFVLTDLDVFDGFKDDVLLHYVCGNVLDQVTVTLFHG